MKDYKLQQTGEEVQKILNSVKEKLEPKDLDGYATKKYVEETVDKSQDGKVDKTTKVNNKPLNKDIILSAEDMNVTIFDDEGEEYEVNLGALVRRNAEKLENVTISKADKSELQNKKAIALTDGKYYDNRDKGIGDTANLIMTNLANGKCALADCAEGDKFVISGGGNNFVIVWMFVNSDNVILSKVASGEQILNGVTITAPANATKLIFNSSSLHKKPSLEKVVMLKEEVKQLQEDVENLEEEVSHMGMIGEKTIDIDGWFFRTTGHLTVGELGQTVAEPNNSFACTKIDVSTAEKVHIRTSGTSDTLRPFYFLDKDNNLVYIEPVSTGLDKEMAVPENAMMLYVNYHKGFPVENPGVTVHYNISEYIQQALDNVDTKPLKGKKVVMLGDSITEFVHEGKGIVEYFAEKSGAEVVRCAVGGSHLSRRMAINKAEDLPNNFAAYAGTDVPSVVDALCSKDYSIMTKAVDIIKEISSDDNTYILDNVKGVDIDNVDIVTIFAGTNDWASNVELGIDDDTTEVNNISGAVKYCIQKLLETNPKLEIYFFTPIPRLLNLNDDETWSDKKENELGYLLPTLCQRIIDVSRKQHIPCCDMYWGLGWNLTNIRSYMTTDGTHPYLGFKELAEHELAFVIGKDKPSGSVDAYTKKEADVKFAGKANLNSQGALATGEEQRLVVDFVNIDGKHIEVNIPGVYYNGTTKHIETYKRYGEGVMSIVLLELSENPSVNVVYCDKMTNTLYRWDGSSMVQVGGGSIDAYTKAESDELLKGKVPTSRTINGKPLSQDVTLTGDNIRVSEDDARPMSNAVPLLNNAYKLMLAHTAPVVVHFYDAFSTAVAGANINTETNMYEIWLYKHTTGNGGTSVPPRLIKVWEEELSTDVIYCDEYDNSLMRYDAANNEWVILNDGSGIEIVQDTGQATDKVMSQKAVTDIIGNVEQLLASI